MKNSTCFSQSKLLEFSVVQENSTYLQTLQSASAFLENAGGSIEAIRNDLINKLETAHSERERRLSIEETRIEGICRMLTLHFFNEFLFVFHLEQKKQFERLKENTETERIQLLELVKTLETKLNSITQVFVFDFFCFSFHNLDIP